MCQIIYSNVRGLYNVFCVRLQSNNEIFKLLLLFFFLFHLYFVRRKLIHKNLQHLPNATGAEAAKAQRLNSIRITIFIFDFQKFLTTCYSYIVIVFTPLKSRTSLDMNTWFLIDYFQAKVSHHNDQL